jgi:hypothetical protein
LAPISYPWNPSRASSDIEEVLGMRDLFSLEGKPALVTGGSVGIGAMIADDFVHFGAKVYIIARSEEALKKKKE